MPKSKVTKLEQLPVKEGQKYPAFNIEFEDGTKGFTMSKFVLGQEMEYITEELPTKADPTKTYTRIKRPQVDKYGGGKSKGWDIEGKTRIMCASYAKKLYLTEPFRNSRFSDILEIIVRKPCLKQQTLVTDREKEYVAPIMSYAIDVYMDDWHKAKFRKFKGFKDDEFDVTKELDLIYSIFNQFLKDMLNENKLLDV